VFVGKVFNLSLKETFGRLVFGLRMESFPMAKALLRNPLLTQKSGEALGVSTT